MRSPPGLVPGEVPRDRPARRCGAQDTAIRERDGRRWFQPPRLGMAWRAHGQTGSVAPAETHRIAGGACWRRKTQFRPNGRSRVDAQADPGLSLRTAGGDERVDERGPAVAVEQLALTFGGDAAHDASAPALGGPAPVEARASGCAWLPLQGFTTGTVVVMAAPQLRACCSAGLFGPSRSWSGEFIMVSVEGSPVATFCGPRRRKAMRRGVPDSYRSPRSLSIRCSRSL